MQTNRVKNPRKQRKRFYNAPAHIRHKLMSAPLSKELTEKHKVKTLPVRRGDTVQIQRGDNKGFEGKISRVDLKSYRIYIEGLTREKVDGTNIFVPVHPSKVMIRNLSLDDNRRKAVIARKKPIEQTASKTKPKKAVPVRTAKPKIVLPPVEEVEVKPKIKQVKPKPAPEAVKEVAPANKVEVPKIEKPKEEAPKKAAVAKKSAEKKPTPKVEAKKPAAKAAPAKKAEAKIAEPVEVPAKKTIAKVKSTAKKASAKQTIEKETAPKSRAKPKTSKKIEGGQ